MPIYQYQCLDCNTEFEYLIVHSDNKPSCPNCASVKLEKQMSVFSVGKAKTKTKEKPVQAKAQKSPAKKCSHSKEHVGCSSSYVNSLLKKYG